MDYIINAYEYLINLPRWKKWLIISIFGLIFYVILYYSKIEPLKGKVIEKQKKIESLELTVNKLKILERRKKDLEKKVSQLKTQIKNIEKKLPTGKEDVAQIIDSITKADSGMLIDRIVRKAQINSSYYIKYPYEIKLVGNYPSFISWCEKLSRANRIINFGDIEIHSIEPGKRKGIPKNATISVNLDIEAFTLKE